MSSSVAPEEMKAWVFGVKVRAATCAKEVAERRVWSGGRSSVGLVGAAGRRFILACAAEGGSWI